MTNQFIFWEQIKVIGDSYSAGDYREKELSLDSLLSGPPCLSSLLFKKHSQQQHLLYDLWRNTSLKWTPFDLHTYLLEHIIDTSSNYLPMFLNFSGEPSLILCLITQKTAPREITALRPSERLSSQCELNT